MSRLRPSGDGVTGLGLFTLAVDLGCWVGGLLLAVGIRFGFRPPVDQLVAVAVFAPLLLALQALIGDFVGVYRDRRGRDGEPFDELYALAGATMLATGAGTAFNALLEDPPVPQSIPLAGGILALLGMLAVRLVRRERNASESSLVAWHEPNDRPPRS